MAIAGVALIAPPKGPRAGFSPLIVVTEGLQLPTYKVLLIRRS